MADKSVGRIATAIAAVCLALTVGLYCLYLIINRILASLLHINHFGIDDRPWVTLGGDTVATGGVLLVAILILSLKARTAPLFKGGFAGLGIRSVVVVSSCALLLLLGLVLSPGTAFR